jgi:hypothetical protein
MSTNITFRKNRFTKDLMDHLAQLPDGAWGHRKKVKITLRSMANDMAFLDILPMRLKNVKPDTIIDLVKYWHRHKQKPKTIKNKLSALRRILSTLKEPIVIPSNKELGVVMITSRKRNLYPKIELIDPETIPLYPVSIVRDISTLQYLFGLKLTEAIRFNSSMVQEKFIDIPRSISFNKKDRRVFICSEAQKEFITKSKTTLLERLPIPRRHYSCFMGLYDYALTQLKINHRDYFRYSYIRNRYQDLLEKHDQFEAFDLLKAEVGYTQLSQIKGVLSCQDDS